MEAGFYWIKVRAEDDWEPAQWDPGGGWSLLADAGLHDAEFIPIIGPRIEPPPGASKHEETDALRRERDEARLAYDTMVPYLQERRATAVQERDEARAALAKLVSMDLASLRTPPEA